MKRLTFAFIFGGAEYTVPINPFNYEKPRFGSVKEYKALDGRSTHQYKPRNFELHKFTWKNLPYDDKFSDMIDELITYEDEYLWMLEGTSGTELNDVWKPIRCIDILVTYPKAQARRLACTSLEFSFIIAKGI
jgi:hypothetical protein